MDPRFIDELAKKLTEGLPAGVRSLQQDFESNFKAVLRSTLGKLDLVTREEFEVQSAVLARTRERLKVFEDRIAALETEATPRKAPARKKAASKASSKKSGKTRSKTGSKASKNTRAGKTGKSKE